MYNFWNKSNDFISIPLEKHLMIGEALGLASRVVGCLKRLNDLNQFMNYTMDSQHSHCPKEVFPF